MGDVKQKVDFDNNKFQGAAERLCIYDGDSVFQTLHVPPAGWLQHRS